jgi:hypothetical protein
LRFGILALVFWPYATDQAGIQLISDVGAPETADRRPAISPPMSEVKDRVIEGAAP